MPITTGCAQAWGEQASLELPHGTSHGVNEPFYLPQQLRVAGGAEQSPGGWRLLAKCTHTHNIWAQGPKLKEGPGAHPARKTCPSYGVALAPPLPWSFSGMHTGLSPLNFQWILTCGDDATKVDNTVWAAQKTCQVNVAHELYRVPQTTHGPSVSSTVMGKVLGRRTPRCTARSLSDIGTYEF